VNRAVLLDRDGVLVPDEGLLTDPGRLRLLPGVPAALTRLAAAGWRLAVVTNQPVVARGLIDEAGLAAIHRHLTDLILAAGGPRLDGIFACPHHPEGTVAAYRQACACRKPRPGLLLAAAAAHGYDLARSWMVGDRPSDIAAGRAAGCRTILAETGKHTAAPIRGAGWEAGTDPDHRCADLAAAAGIILA
jgi:D-glycero-D-manno-heptose 1,7-bisphosphate phosphatase